MIMNSNYHPSQSHHISEVNTNVSKGVDTSGMIRLSKDFVPSNLDVICARGKHIYDHEGNRRFRSLVKDHLPTYSQCVTKMQKTQLVSHIIDTVRRASPHGGFVKQVNGTWYEVGNRRAKEKTGQTMRDLLHTRYASSTKAKARARQQLREDRAAGTKHLGSMLARSTSGTDDFLRQRARLSSQQSLGRSLERYANTFNNEYQFQLAADTFAPRSPPSDYQFEFDVNSYEHKIQPHRPSDFDPIPMNRDFNKSDNGQELIGEVSGDIFNLEVGSLYDTFDEI